MRSNALRPTTARPPTTPLTPFYFCPRAQPQPTLDPFAMEILSDTAAKADHVKVDQEPTRSAKRDRAPTNLFVPTMESDQPRAPRTPTTEKHNKSGSRLEEPEMAKPMVGEDEDHMIEPMDVELMEKADANKMDAPQDGQRIEILFENVWLACEILFFNKDLAPPTPAHTVLYETHDTDPWEETIDLTRIKWRPAPKKGDRIRILYEDKIWRKATVVSDGPVFYHNNDVAADRAHHKLQFDDDDAIMACDLAYQLWKPEEAYMGRGEHNGKRRR